MHIEKLWSVGLAALLAVSGAASAQSGEHRGPSGGAQGGQGDLQVYFIDVEGGQSTLFVMPDGESLLVDTGNTGQMNAFGYELAQSRRLGTFRGCGDYYT